MTRLMTREYYETSETVVIDCIAGIIVLPYDVLCAAEFRFQGKTYPLAKYRGIETTSSIENNLDGTADLCTMCCFEDHPRSNLSEEDAKVERWLFHHNIFMEAVLTQVGCCTLCY